MKQPMIMNFSDIISNSLNFSMIPIEIESIICTPKRAKGFILYELCFTLTTVTIPSSVTTIGEYAFYKRSSLASITIPSSVTTIGDGAFYRCSSLTQIAIPSSVKMIGKDAFSGSSSLAQIAIPSSVTMTGKDVFSGISSLARKTVINNDEDIYFEQLALMEELNNIVNFEDDSTVYIADLPINQFTYPPLCLIDEDFIRTLFQDFDFYHDSVVIKTKIGRNGSPYSFAYIKFASREEALRAADELNYIRLDYVPIRLIIIDEEGKNNIFNSNKNCVIFQYSDRSIEAYQVHKAFSHFGRVISVKMPLEIVGKGSEKQCSSRG